ncbi:MAG: hypothetical protein VX311_12385, partial [Planctomycetota bacterium]|nr:hypothetical protein [Planctomycetota bacterium]
MNRLPANSPVTSFRSRVTSGLIAVLLALMLVPTPVALAADNDPKPKNDQPSEEEILLLMRMFS